MPKPSDFFLSIVTFIGVLFPGAVFVFLLEGALRDVLQRPPWDTQLTWVVALVSAYIVGHILLTISQLLNDTVEPIAGLLRRKLPNLVARERGDYMKIYTPEKIPTVEKASEKSFLFHEALSRVRLGHADAAAAEIDRQMADYKLLRNLVIVFLIYSVWSVFHDSNYVRAIWFFIFALLTFAGFACAYLWAELLAFQYARLLSGKSSANPKNTGDVAV